MKDIKVIIATHKEYPMPNDEMYYPLHVGAKGKPDLPYLKDYTGDNISSKNPYYCELTATYWVWKNIDAEYYGLLHYRRYFAGKYKFCAGKRTIHILTNEEAQKYLNKVDVILPRKRNYYIETLYSHYDHTMYVEPLDIAGNIIKEKYPEYYREFEMLKRRRSAHMFNMFIMKKNIFQQYCNWIFDVLGELEKRVDPSQYNPFHARFFGRVAELLFDVWLRTNNIKYKELKVVTTQRINWIKKGSCFLKAKFKGTKYERSF